MCEGDNLKETSGGIVHESKGFDSYKKISSLLYCNYIKNSVSDMIKESSNRESLSFKTSNLEPPSFKPNENGKSWNVSHIPRYVKCFSCTRIIKEDHFSEHLLFGEVSCSLCNLAIKDCPSFQVCSVKSSMGDTKCDHYFSFKNNCVDYVTKQLSVSPSENYNAKLILLENYINKLKSIETKAPWQQAIRKCRAFIVLQQSRCSVTKEKNKDATTKDKFGITKRKELDVEYRTELQHIHEEYVEDILAQDYDIGQLQEATEFVKVPETPSNEDIKYTKLKQKKENIIKQRREKTGKKQRRSTSTDCMEYVPIPSDGFYYVSTKPIEECPNCYELLCPSQFSVNVDTFLMTVICIGCGLTVFITTGSSSVQIITETNDNLESGDERQGATVTNSNNHKKRDHPKKP